MFDIFAYLSHHIYMSIFPYLTKNVFKPRFIICIFIVGTEQSLVLNKCSIIFIKWIDKVHIHFPYSHHKHLRGHNILTSFFKRILSFITDILSSKIYTESGYLPSAFEQKGRSWGGLYKGQACIKLCSIILLHQKTGSVDEHMASRFSPEFPKRRPAVPLGWSDLFYVLCHVLVACEYHTTTHPQ